MIKTIAKLIFAIWQRRQHDYGKPWKSKKRKRYRHGQDWGHYGYPSYGHEYGHPGYPAPTAASPLINRRRSRDNIKAAMMFYRSVREQ
jgi:hypothetical protein